jgi:hypothetical protein
MPGEWHDMANGNNGRFSRVDDLILKIGAGVGVVILSAMIFFGLRVYTFMSVGDRLTPEMAREEFVHIDVYERDREYLERELRSMNKKLDKLVDAQEK